MRRKIKDSVIDTLENGIRIFFTITGTIFLICAFPFSFFDHKNAVICFIIWGVCLIISGVYGWLDFLRERNDKIDEEEKARQKIIDEKLKIEAEERIRTQSQIWVIG